MIRCTRPAMSRPVPSATGTPRAMPPGASRPRHCQHARGQVGLGAAWALALLSAAASPVTAQTLPIALHIETCTAATQSCVGEAEQAHAWLPPGADARALIDLVEHSLKTHGLPRETPVRLSCSRGPTDARLLAALRAAGLTAVASSGEPTAADWASAGDLSRPAPAPSAAGKTR